MSPRDTADPSKETLIGKIEFSPMSKADREMEIDTRVGVQLAEREAHRALYQRGFFDCLYIALLVLSIYWLWPYFTGKET